MSLYNQKILNKFSSNVAYRNFKVVIENIRNDTKVFRSNAFIAYSFLSIGILMPFLLRGSGPIRATLTLFCIGHTIILRKTNLPIALVYGLIGGISNTFASVEPFSFVNLLSIPAGVICMSYLSRIKIFNKKNDTVIGISTIISGIIYLTPMIIFSVFPLKLCIFVMLPTVFVCGIANFILFKGSQKLLKNFFPN